MFNYTTFTGTQMWFTNPFYWQTIHYASTSGLKSRITKLLRSTCDFCEAGIKSVSGNIWRRSLQKLSRILRNLGFALETFANFWRVSVSVSENLASEKNVGFGFRKFGLGKKFQFLFWKVWSQKSVSVSVKILVSSFSAVSKEED